MTIITRFWTEQFVVWVAAFSVAAYVFPSGFSWFRPYIVPALGAIMFGMGMTLIPDDFLRVIRTPRAVVCGVLGQFFIMPLVALGLADLFALSPELAMGLIILGSCPGGTASNVIAYLAKADVALSVTMTACSTLLAIILTPALVSALGGQFLPVDRGALFLSVVKIILLPVTAGLLVRYWFKDRAQRVLMGFPTLSVLFIVLIVACVVALARDKLPETLGKTGIVVLVHNLLGLALGYGLAVAFRLPRTARRTVAIEVGMQNSGLGVALAQKHFTDALVALPASLFSVIHNLTGSAIANLWRKTAEE